MGSSRHSKYELVESELSTEFHQLKVAKALYSCTASGSDDLSFKKGDYLGIIDDDDPNWWLGCYLTNLQKGYVPSNYVCIIKPGDREESEIHGSQNSENTSDFCPWELEKWLSSRTVMRGPLPDDKEDLEIQDDCLEVVHSLGKGNFGEVFYGYCYKTFEVAIKYLPIPLLSDDFRREVSTLKGIKHPAILRLFAICSDKEPFCMILEYMCRGQLQQYLKSDLGKELKLPSLMIMALQIADGMKYLESEKLIYKKLAARNILVGKHNIVKLGDFGLEGIMSEKSYNKERNQLFKWTPPEALASGEYTIKSDVWSFGVVLYEIFTHGGTPYEGLNNDEITEFLNKNYRLAMPNDPECSDPIYETMLFCWKRNPEDRPTFEYLFHFFMDYEETSYKSYYRIPFPVRKTGK